MKYTVPMNEQVRSSDMICDAPVATPLARYAKDELPKNLRP